MCNSYPISRSLQKAPFYLDFADCCVDCKNSNTINKTINKLNKQCFTKRLHILPHVIYTISYYQQQVYDWSEACSFIIPVHVREMVYACLCVHMAPDAYHYWYWCMFWNVQGA